MYHVPESAREIKWTSPMQMTESVKPRWLKSVFRDAAFVRDLNSLSLSAPMAIRGETLVSSDSSSSEA
jgi:hypothetical protein